MHAFIFVTLKPSYVPLNKGGGISSASRYGDKAAALTREADGDTASIYPPLIMPCRVSRPHQTNSGLLVFQEKRVTDLKFKYVEGVKRTAEFIAHTFRLLTFE